MNSFEEKSEQQAEYIRTWALAAGAPSQQRLVVTRTHHRANEIMRALERRAEYGDESFHTEAMFSFLRGATVRVFAIGDEHDAYRVAGMHFGAVYWADPPASDLVATLVHLRVRETETPFTGLDLLTEAGYQGRRTEGQPLTEDIYSLDTGLRYTGFDVLNVEPSDVLVDTEWRYEEGPCEIHDMTIRPSGDVLFTIPAATYEGIDRAFNKWWSPQPRKAVEGDIYPYSALTYWIGKQIAAANLAWGRAYLEDCYRLFGISDIMRGRSDELTGTG